MYGCRLYDLHPTRSRSIRDRKGKSHRGLVLKTSRMKRWLVYGVAAVAAAVMAILLFVSPARLATLRAHLCKVEHLDFRERPTVEVLVAMLDHLPEGSQFVVCEDLLQARVSLVVPGRQSVVKATQTVASATGAIARVMPGRLMDPPSIRIYCPSDPQVAVLLRRGAPPARLTDQ